MTETLSAEDVKARICALPPLRAVIGRERLSARRALGQHFLLDLNLTRRIARAAGPHGAGTTIEIGPGPGGLTRALLLEGAQHVIAIERDRRALAALRDLAEAAGSRLTLMQGDARRIDCGTLGQPPRHLVANLPYNIATLLIIDWLRTPRAFASIPVMVQKEVARRLCATVGSPDYGRLGILARWLTEPELLFEVPARAFTPPPAVTSALVRLTPRPEPLCPASRSSLERVTASAFGQRRTMLRSSLRALGGADLLRRAAIDPAARPETLDIADFCRLARLCDAGPGSVASPEPVDEVGETGQSCPAKPLAGEN